MITPLQMDMMRLALVAAAIEDSPGIDVQTAMAAVANLEDHKMVAAFEDRFGKIQEEIAHG